MKRTINLAAFAVHTVNGSRERRITGGAQIVLILKTSLMGAAGNGTLSLHEGFAPDVSTSGVSLLVYDVQSGPYMKIGTATKSSANHQKVTFYTVLR
jgi:hypothetical protein